MDQNKKDGLKNSRNSKRGGRPSLKERINYWFDNIMTKGMIAKVGFLIAFTIVCTNVAGLIVFLLFHKSNIRGSIWTSFLHVIDPGTIAGDQGGGMYLFVMFILTIFGLLFIGTLIGILNNGMDAKMERLAKGKSRVLEQGHTVVLGYNDVTIAILNELMEANKNHKRVPVLVMDRMRTIDMESEVHNRLDMNRHTKLIFRTGDIYNYDDLDICNLRDCKSIIINAMDDFEAIKAILACTGKLNQIEEEEENPRKVYITAVIRNEENETEAKLAGGDRLKLIVYPRIMAKIIAGAGRQPGMSYVYTELFNYDNNEIYCDSISPSNELTDNVKMFDINQYLEDTIVIGGIPKEEVIPEKGGEEGAADQQGRYYSFPAFPNHLEFKDFSKFFILEQDDNAIKVLPAARSRHGIREDLIRTGNRPDTDPISIVIIGVSPMLKQILTELDGYYIKASKQAEVKIVDDEEIDLNEYCPDGKNQFKVLNISKTEKVDVYDLKVLEQVLDDKVTSVLLLTENIGDLSKEDELVLMQLIYLRDIRERYDYDFNISCEMNLNSNRQLAELTGHNDFIVGSNITALIMTQISEYHELYELFDELLSSEGAEIYMHRANTYLNFKEPVVRTDFYTMSEAVSRRREVLIGFQKLKYRDPGVKCHEYEEPVLNPPKWEMNNVSEMKLIEYELLPEDLLVVISDS